MFERNIHSFTLKEQVALSTKTVCIVGLGGVGGYTAEILARTGIHKFILIDEDKYDETNLNRQNNCYLDTIGNYKVDEVKNNILRMNKNFNVKTYKNFIDENTSKKLVKEKIDIVIDCADGVINMLNIFNLFNQKMNLPYVSGGIGDTHLWVSTFNPQSKYSIYDIFHGNLYGKQIFANQAEILISAGLIMQEAINYLLDRDWNTRDKIISFNHKTFEMKVKNFDK